MWPWAHAALGYLLYTAFRRAGDARPPTGPAVVVLGVGTQLPDLVDKLGAWYLYVLPTGRSLAHSLWFAALVVLAVGAYARARGHDDLATAFGVGYLAGLLGDVLQPLVTGKLQYLAFLGWPLVAQPDYRTEKSVWAHLIALEPTPLFLFGLVLTSVALIVWMRDGTPGLGTLRTAGHETLAAIRAALE